MYQFKAVVVSWNYLKSLCKFSLISSPTGIQVAKYIADMKLNNSLSKRLQWMQSNFFCAIFYMDGIPLKIVCWNMIIQGMLQWHEWKVGPYGSSSSFSRHVLKRNFGTLLSICLSVCVSIFSLPSFSSFPIFIPTSLNYPYFFLPITPLLPLLSISFSHMVWMLSLRSGLSFSWWLPVILIRDSKHGQRHLPLIVCLKLWTK